MGWVDKQEEGWCDLHLATYANVAGPTLGVPSAIPALLTGTLHVHKWML